MIDLQKRPILLDEQVRRQLLEAYVARRHRLLHEGYFDGELAICERGIAWLASVLPDVDVAELLVTSDQD